MKILAISSSRSGNSAYLEPALPFLKDFLGNKPQNIAFIPFASVNNDYDAYEAMVQQATAAFPWKIRAVKNENARELLQEAEVIMTGGGNTFKLLHDLYENEVLDIIRKKVSEGTPYVGWSAGTNITGLTISTTNDMPIIQPRSFKALAFLPFQINPHYLNQKTEGFHGETRDQRLEEFVLLNPGIPVIGLPEGTALRREGSKLSYLGNIPAVLFQYDGNNISKKEIHRDEDLSWLLSTKK